MWVMTHELAIAELAHKCNELWKEKLGDFMENWGGFF